MSSEAVKWFDADAPFVRLTGFAFRRKGAPFHRFEEGAVLPPAVESLSRHTPGGQLAFMTDSPFIRIKFAPAHESHLSVNTRIGAGGLDLYMGKPGKKKYFCGVTRMKLGEKQFEQTLVDGLTPEMREYTLHFPLYAGVEYLSVGVSENAEVRLPSPWKNELPVVYYGTSIIHGGCANRPGMMLTNILSRRLDRPFLNFGFSGSGKGEPEVFQQLARIGKCALFVLDYGPNVSADTMKATLRPGIDILRAEHPETPILVVGKFHFASEYIETFSLTQRAPDPLKMTAYQKEEVRRRRRRGDKNIFFTSGDMSKLPDWTEFTIDGVHPTDLGFYKFSEIMEKAIKKYLRPSPEKF